MQEQTTETKELVTEVTSVAQEEAKTGEEILPKNLTAQEIVARASMSFYKSRKDFGQVFMNLSSRGKMRVMNAVLDLPTGGVRVDLKEDNEKLAFRIGQQVIQNRFIITQYHINEEIKRMREEKEAAASTPPTTEISTQTADTLQTNEGEVK